MDQREAEILRAILAAHGSRTDCRLWRCNVTVLYDRNGRPVRSLPNGHPDIAGIYSGGKAFWIEVKSATGKNRAEQVAFQAMLVKYGGSICVARSVEDVTEFLLKLSAR